MHQTACFVVNLVRVNDFASLFNCTTEVGPDNSYCSCPTGSTLTEDLMVTLLIGFQLSVTWQLNEIVYMYV